MRAVRRLIESEELAFISRFAETSIVATNPLPRIANVAAAGHTRDEEEDDDEDDDESRYTVGDLRSISARE